MKGLFFAMMVLLMFCVPAAGEDKGGSRQEISKKEKRLDDVKKQIKEEKKGIKIIAEKETGILGELESINKGLVEKREELRGAQASLAAVHKEVSFTNANIARIEKQKRVYAERLRARLKAIYKMRRGESMDLLFTASSSGELGRRHKYLTMIMDRDSDIIDGFEKSIEDLGIEKKRLSVLLAEAEGVKRSVEAKKTEAESLHRERLSLLGEVKSEKDRRLKVVKELEQAAAELSDLLARLRTEEEPEGPSDVSSGFAGMRGRLPSPVEGPVVSEFGKVKHPKFQTVTFNNGIVIEAPVGTPVRSVYDGKVIYVGWLKGYGQVLIIDHKGGYYTLFAHLAKALKDKGDEVKKGAEVGLVGDTGSQGAAGLYFEIRQRGVPRDPSVWLSRR